MAAAPSLAGPPWRGALPPRARGGGGGGGGEGPRERYLRKGLRGGPASRCLCPQGAEVGARSCVRCWCRRGQEGAGQGAGGCAAAQHGAVQPRSPSASGTGSGGRGLSAPATAGRRRSLGCVSPQRPEVLFGAGPRGEVDPVLRSRAKPMLRFVLTTRSSRARGTCYVSLWGKRRAYMHWSRCSRHGLTPGKRHLNLFGSPQLGTICSLTGVFWH